MSLENFDAPGSTRGEGYENSRSRESPVKEAPANWVCANIQFANAKIQEFVNPGIGRLNTQLDGSPEHELSCLLLFDRPTRTRTHGKYLVYSVKTGAKGSPSHSAIEYNAYNMCV